MRCAGNVSDKTPNMLLYLPKPHVRVFFSITENCCFIQTSNSLCVAVLILFESRKTSLDAHQAGSVVAHSSSS
jgi:hypothetical protein